MPDLHQLELRAGVHQTNRVAGLYAALKHADVDDNALVAVIDRVKYQRLQRQVGVAGGRGNVLHHALQHVLDADAHLGGHARRLHAGQTDDVLDLLGNRVGVGAGQVDLVQDRHDLQVVIQRQIAVGKGLRLHALAGIHDQHRALAGGQAAADLVLKVHVTRGVD